MINMVVGLLFFVILAGGGWLVMSRALGLTVKGEPRLRNVRYQVWHPSSPGVRILVRPGPLRRMGLVHSDFATSGEMRRYHRDHRNNLMAVGSPSRAFNSGDKVTKDGRIIEGPTIEEQNRKLEHEMGIGPFAGREDYCDLSKKRTDGKYPCGHEHHVDIDMELTQTGKPAPKPETTRIPFPAFEGDSGERPKVDPNTVRWADAKSLERAEELAHEGRIDSYCLGGHDHVEIRSLQGTVRRVCDRRQGHRGPPPGPRPSFAKLYEANLEKVRKNAMPPVIMGERIGDTSITYYNKAEEADRAMRLYQAGVVDRATATRIARGGSDHRPLPGRPL